MVPGALHSGARPPRKDSVGSFEIHTKYLRLGSELFGVASMNGCNVCNARSKVPVHGRRVKEKQLAFPSGNVLCSPCIPKHPANVIDEPARLVFGSKCHCAFL